MYTIQSFYSILQEGSHMEAGSFLRQTPSYAFVMEADLGLINPNTLVMGLSLSKLTIRLPKQYVTKGC